MKTTRIFFMAALALTFAACSNDDNDIITPEPVKTQGIPFTATITVDNSATTRALSENGTTIEATWATGEKVALIYNAGSTPTKTEAEVTKQTDGTATISATLAAGATDGSAVTIIYPATAADGTTGNVKANVLAAQNGLLTGTGSIAEKYDLRKGTGKLSISDGKATVNNGTPNTTVSLTNQIAIFKFTIQNLSAAPKTATEFKISDGSGNVITTVTPLSATGTLYVALPALATGTYWFDATIDSKPYIAKATVGTATTAGNYYRTTVKMATFGDFILDDGKFAPSSSTGTKVAMIAYVGSDAETSTTYKHGLALALSDVSTSTYAWCSQTASTCLSSQYSDESAAKADMAGLANTDALVGHGTHTHNAANAARNYSATHPAGTSAWFLPSAGQWDKMATAAGGYSNLGLESSRYWSSSERNARQAWYFLSGDGYWYVGSKGDDHLVRSCLAF